MHTQTLRIVCLAASQWLASTAVDAAEPAWGFEVAPYIWAAGIDGDITVRGRKTAVDLGFSDLFDAVDIAGSVLGSAYYGHLVVSTQLDYFSLDSEKLDADDQPQGGRLESQSFLGLLAAGYRFGEPSDERHIDVLLGLRYADIDNTLRLNGVGRFRRQRDYVDPVLVASPSLRLSERWRLNPSFSIGGGGDSNFIWEVQPQIQYQINDRLAARLGYRHLHYDIESDNGRNEFDGAYKGFIIGVGGQFGKQP